MTTEKAIKELDKIVFLAGDKTHEKALQHLIDIAKRFEGAVEVDVTGRDIELFNAKTKELIINSSTLYAVPKENE